MVASERSVRIFPGVRLSWPFNAEVIYSVIDVLFHLISQKLSIQTTV